MIIEDNTIQTGTELGGWIFLSSVEHSQVEAGTVIKGIIIVGCTDEGMLVSDHGVEIEPAQLGCVWRNALDN